MMIGGASGRPGGGGGGARGAGGDADGARPRALSGRPIDAITLAAAVRGDLSPADLRVHPDTLRHQAEVAEAHGNPQLGENLRRAAELTALPDDEVLAILPDDGPSRTMANRCRTYRRTPPAEPWDGAFEQSAGMLKGSVG